MSEMGLSVQQNGLKFLLKMIKENSGQINIQDSFLIILNSIKVKSANLSVNV